MSRNPWASFGFPWVFLVEAARAAAKNFGQEVSRPEISPEPSSIRKCEP
jgi:hypothetical protein